MKTNHIVFWIATGLLSLMMLMSAGMYLFNNAEIAQVFTSLGYPTWIIKPFAVAKILGVIALVYNGLKGQYDTLTEWAYAGFTFDFLLAFGSHIAVGDGQSMGALIALVLLGVSYYFRIRRRG